MKRFMVPILSATLMLASSATVAATKASSDTFKGTDVFDRIVSKAQSEHWTKLPIGELMGKVAMQLEGTPYVANTLELSPDTEQCSVNLKGLDCVTFFESTLDMARMLKHGGKTPDDLLREVSFTRYRGGKPGDYTTRLHYTTDWFVDNEKKGVVRILSELPGEKPFPLHVGFMTSHPDKYVHLKEHPELIPQLKQDEDAINGRSMKFVPVDQIASIEPLLKTGDIIGITTDAPGIDIAHTGLIVRTADGVAHFMDASSRKSTMKVVLEPERLSETLKRSKHWTGAMFARPLEPGSSL